jgi:O-antigen/teichoic acid export membrane protein
VGAAKHIKQLGIETLIYGISGTISRFVGIFLVPLYTRIFTPTDYGIIGSVTAMTGLLSTFIILGLDSASARWYYDTSDTTRRHKVISSWFWCQFTVGVATALVLLSFAPQVSNLLFKSEEYALVLRLVALTIPVGAFTKVVGNWLRYQRRAWMTAVFFTSNSLGMITIIFLFVLVWHKGLTGLYLAHLIAGLVMVPVAAIILKAWIGPKHISLQILKEMLLFGLPLVPAAVAAWVTASSDRLILPLFFDQAETGIYTVAISISSGVALVTSAFQMAWGPFAFSILHEQNSTRVYGEVFSIYALLGCLLCTGMSLFAPQLLYVFTTPRYYAAASSVPFLVFAYLAIGASYIASLGSSIAKKPVPIATSILIGAGVNTVLNFILIPHLGKDGAAIATLIAYLSALVYVFFASQRSYHIPYRSQDALICFGFSWLLIAIDHFLIPTEGLGALGARAVMCLFFIPLGFGLGIAKPAHVRWLVTYLSRRRRKVTR